MNREYGAKITCMFELDVFSYLNISLALLGFIFCAAHEVDLGELGVLIR